MIVTVTMRIVAPDDTRESQVLAAAMDAVDDGTPYRVASAVLAEYESPRQPQGPWTPRPANPGYL
jgi:hypothetical protein